MTDLTNANPAAVLALLDAAEELDEVRAQVARGALCPMCSTGTTRRTVGMTCQLCGTDYGSPEYPALRRDSEQVSKAVLADALAVRAERDALAAKVERVRAMHRECPYADPELRAVAPSLPAFVCQHCWGQADAAVPHPCPTIRALDGTETDHG